MSRARAAVAVILFAAAAAAAIAPEIRRYGASIDLNLCERALIASASLQGDRKRRIVAAIREKLESVAARLPGDVRPPYLLGSSALLLGEPAEAIEHFRRALSIEERPETDLNLSRAHARAGDAESAAQDALRAAWLSPALLKQMDPATRAAIRQQIDALEQQLRSGSASAIPSLAKSDAPVRQNDR